MRPVTTAVATLDRRPPTDLLSIGLDPLTPPIITYYTIISVSIGEFSASICERVTAQQSQRAYSSGSRLAPRELSLTMLKAEEDGSSVETSKETGLACH